MFVKALFVSSVAVVSSMLLFALMQGISKLNGMAVPVKVELPVLNGDASVYWNKYAGFYGVLALVLFLAVLGWSYMHMKTRAHNAEDQLQPAAQA